MKYFVTTLLILSVTIPAFAELTQNDLDKIRLIVKDEVDTAIKTSETRMKEYVDTKIGSVNQRFDDMNKSVNQRFDDMNKSVNQRFDNLNKRITDARNLGYALIALIGVVIGIPAWRNRKNDQELKKQVEILTQRIEALENGRIQSP